MSLKSKLFSAKLSINDQIMLSKRLSFLIGAGIPIEKAMSIVTEQSRKQIKPILKTITEHIHNGQSLSQSFLLFPTSFPSFVIKLMRAGEESGLLQESLIQVSSDLTRRKAIFQKLVSACVYPLVIVLGTIGLSLFLLLIIFPKIRTLFQSLHVKLPLTTRIIIGLSDISQHYGILIVITIILIVSLVVLIVKKSQIAQYNRDAIRLKVPLLNSLLKNYLLSSFYRTLGVMLNAHIPINKALEYASESVSNKVYLKAFTYITQENDIGKNISESLKIFPHLFNDAEVQLIEVGETSGTLSDTLIYLSDILDQEIESSLKILTSLIEPLLMVTMGLVVGFIALSIISPIYEITQNLNH